MTNGILKLFSQSGTINKVLDFINHSSFDELMELDPVNDRMQIIYHVEGKYQMPVTKGGYREFYEYAADHFVLSEDREAYMDLMDPERILDRLAGGEIPGTAELLYRVKSLDRESRWVSQLLFSGPQFGLKDGCIYCYIYDVQNIKDREEGAAEVHISISSKPDALTGLPGQKEFFNKAEELLTRIAAGWIMLVIDLEKFKLFNEWYGWDKGNLVLARIGAGLRGDAERSGGLAGYMGDDDFCLFVPEEAVDIEDLFEKIYQVLKRFGISVGFLPAFGIARLTAKTSASDLFDQASFACGLAKNNFKNRICIYDHRYIEETEKEYRLISEFQKGLVEHEVSFCLQPQCRASNGKIVGAEALARWRKKDGTMVSPGIFVPVLEKYGFVTDLDKYMWREVAAWVRSWLDKGNPLIPVSLNVSQVDFFTIDVPAFFEELVIEYHLPWNALKIEITESACAEDSQKVREAVVELREKGFLVLMDDFGSGYSSLNMLHELEVDVIKIDAFFLNLESDTEIKGIHILESVVNMARNMGIPIIMEGVEKKEQIEFLTDLGCRYMQGYYFYKPMGIEEFEELISKPERLDLKGFLFKESEQFKVREFLDESVYSDSMLNNILGPVAIYSWTSKGIDIIRFNEQFYQAVHSPVFHNRLKNIERFMPKVDEEIMKEAMKQAMRDRLNGSSAVLDFYQAGGGASRFLIRFYYMGEEGGSRRFYGSARDVTEITLVQKHLELISRSFSECVIFLMQKDGRFLFEVAAQGLEEMGISRLQLQEELNNATFYDRVAPENREMLHKQCMDAIVGIDFSSYFTLINPEGKRINLFMRTEYIDDPTSYVKCLVIISKRQSTR